jgi:4-amino-4-deoxy-L-arabinose transferase-like glycosyltransferase
VAGPLLFCCFFAVYTAALAVSSYAGKPPIPGDGQDYDNIALQIVHGRGVAVDFRDPEWRRPYEQSNDDGRYDAILKRTEGYTPTTYRPPLLPILLAGSYAIFGRTFLPWQLLACAAVALGLTLVSLVARRAGGTAAMLLTAALAIATRSYFTYTSRQTLLTEPLAILLVSILIYGVALASEHPRAAAAICGVDLAALGLARNLFIPLSLAAPLLVGAIALRGGRRQQALSAALVCAALAIALQAPWWIRNVRLLQAPMPFGTQSGLAIFSGFSDGAVQHHGVFWDATVEERGTAYRRFGVTCLACSERDLARSGWRGAFAWMRENSAVIPWLAWQKVKDTCRSAPAEAGGAAWCYLLAPFAPLAVRRRGKGAFEATAAAIGLVLFNVGIIAATWSAGWRYMVPVEPLLQMLTAVVIASAITAAVRKIDERRRT